MDPNIIQPQNNQEPAANQPLVSPATQIQPQVITPGQPIQPQQFNEQPTSGLVGTQTSMTNALPDGNTAAPGQVAPVVSSGGGGGGKSKFLLIAFITVVVLVVITVAAVLMAPKKKKAVTTKKSDTSQTNSNGAKGPQPASALDVEQANNSINQDISNPNDDNDFPANQLDDKSLNL